MSYDVILFTATARRWLNIKAYGAYKCAHELRQAGYSVLVVNHFHQFDLDEIKGILKSAVGNNTIFVGISNTFLFVEDGLTQRQNRFLFCPQGEQFQQDFVDYIKQLQSDCKIVVGGANTTYSFNNPLVDYAVIGYSDNSLVNLANHLKNKEPLRKSKKSLFKTILIDDVIAEGFDFSNSTMTWTDDDIVLPNEVLPIEIARGCVFSCKFCNYILNGKKNYNYIKRYDLIKQELEHNYKVYGVTKYIILDDTFNDSEFKLDRMLEVVQSLDFKPIFWCYTRLDLLSKHPQTIKKMYDIGVRAMYFGIETLHKKTGTIIGKGYSPSKQIDTINYIKDTYGSDMSLYGSFIVGLPEEKMSSVVNTYNKIINNEIKLDAWMFKPLNIYKKNNYSWDSAFGVDLTKYGYKEIPTDDNLRSTVKWCNQHMTEEQAIEISAKFKEGRGTRSSNISGQYIFELMNLGFDFNNLNNTIIADIGVELIDHKYYTFINTYKQALLKHI